MYAALPVELQRCPLGCALFLRRRRLVEVAKTEPDRVLNLVCQACFSVLVAVAAR